MKCHLNLGERACVAERHLMKLVEGGVMNAVARERGISITIIGRLAEHTILQALKRGRPTTRLPSWSTARSEPVIH